LVVALRSVPPSFPHLLFHLYFSIPDFGGEGAAGAVRPSYWMGWRQRPGPHAAHQAPMVPFTVQQRHIILLLGRAFF
jgi:hypothetical protein